jgi:hypothetical protein
MDDDRKAFPPIHFWCDCEDEPVFEGEFDTAETATFDEIKAPDLAAEQARPSGFKWDPAQYANLEPLDLRGFPLELQPMFEAFAKRRGFTAQRLHWWMSRLGWKRTPLPAAVEPPQAAAPVPSPVPAFLPVRVVPDRKSRLGSAPRRPAGIIIELGSRHLRLEGDFDEQVLYRVVQLLEQVP